MNFSVHSGTIASVSAAAAAAAATLRLWERGDRVERSAKAVLRLNAFQHSLFHNLSVTGLMSLYLCVHVPKHTVTDSPSWKQTAFSSGDSKLSIEWVSSLVMRPHCDQCHKIANWSGPVCESSNRHFQFSE